MGSGLLVMRAGCGAAAGGFPVCWWLRAGPWVSASRLPGAALGRAACAVAGVARSGNRTRQAARARIMARSAHSLTARQRLVTCRNVLLLRSCLRAGGRLRAVLRAAVRAGPMTVIYRNRREHERAGGTCPLARRRASSARLGGLRFPSRQAGPARCCCRSVAAPRHTPPCLMSRSRGTAGLWLSTTYRLVPCWWLRSRNDYQAQSERSPSCFSGMFRHQMRRC
jgi:hypothetical protein